MRNPVLQGDSYSRLKVSLAAFGAPHPSQQALAPWRVGWAWISSSCLSRAWWLFLLDGKGPRETLEFPSLCLKMDSDPGAVFKSSNDGAKRVTAGWRGGSMGEGLALKAWAPEFR